MTFEEARDAFFASDGPYLGPVKMDAWKKGWYARDAELAEKDRRIVELEGQHRAVTTSEYYFCQKVKALEARIEAGMARAKLWEHEGDRMLAEFGDKQTKEISYAYADELRAVLGEPVRKP